MGEEEAEEADFAHGWNTEDLADVYADSLLSNIPDGNGDDMMAKVQGSRHDYCIGHVIVDDIPRSSLLAAQGRAANVIDMHLYCQWQTHVLMVLHR